MVFEDLHFADQGLLDFIDHMLEWSRSSPITIVTLARPELLDKRPNWGAGKRSFTSIYLEPLSSDARACRRARPAASRPPAPGMARRACRPRRRRGGCRPAPRQGPPHRRPERSRRGSSPTARRRFRAAAGPPLQADRGHLVAPRRDRADAAPRALVDDAIEPPLLAHRGGVDREPLWLCEKSRIARRISRDAVQRRARASCAPRARSGRRSSPARSARRNSSARCSIERALCWPPTITK